MGPLLFQQSFCHQMSCKMDLREVHKLLGEDPNLDKDQANMLKAAACHLTATLIKKAKAKAKAKERRVRRERERKSV